LKKIDSWMKQMEPIKYSCLECKYCFPAVAINTLSQAFPGSPQTQSSLGCSFEINKQQQTWPPIAGEYSAFCEGSTCPVAVSTLGSIELTETLAKNRPRELCIVGKTETENIGVYKVIKNIVTNPTIRYLLLAGKESEGQGSRICKVLIGDNEKVTIVYFL
jgi:tetrahydromethanopterin S-methyltransferase subunit A